MLFIFGVLLEFACVNSYMRRANKYNQMAEKLQNGAKTASYGEIPVRLGQRVQGCRTSTRSVRAAMAGITGDNTPPKALPTSCSRLSHSRGKPYS